MYKQVRFEHFRDIVCFINRSEAAILKMQGTAILVKWLSLCRTHLGREREKGRMRHFGYDLNRHIAIATAKKRLLDALETKSPAQ